MSQRFFCWIGVVLMSMSDDTRRIEEGEKNRGTKDFTSITRNSTVTDSLDTIFDLLSDSRRRYLLYYLSSINGNVAEFEAAVNAVYKYETAGTEGDDQTSQRNVQIGLHHSELPRLADAGVLDYDRRHGTIHFTGHPAIEEWAEHARYKEIE